MQSTHSVLCPWVKWGEKKVGSDRPGSQSPDLNILQAHMMAFFTLEVFFAATLSQFATCIEAKSDKKECKKISTPIMMHISTLIAMYTSLISTTDEFNR